VLLSLQRQAQLITRRPKTLNLQSVTNYDPEPPDGACHWHICLEDDERADLLAALPMAVTWLERALRQRGARVLVHCHAGA
jgi:protein-tyrosine phosphatase